MKIKKFKKRFGGAFKFFLTGTLTLAMGLSLASCGKEETGEENKTETKEWVWVPEYQELDSIQGSSFWEAKLIGDYLYYPIETWGEEAKSYKVCKYSLVDKTTTETEVPVPGEGYCRNFSIMEDGSICALFTEYNYDEATGNSSRRYSMVKVDSQGNQLWLQDMSEYINQENDQIDAMVLDGQNRIYLLCQNYGDSGAEGRILLFDSEGAHQGAINLSSGRGSWINGMMTDKNGKVYTYGHGDMGYELTEVDFDKKSMGETFQNFPGNGNGTFSGGIEKDILTYSDTTVYEYDVASQTSQELLKWLDSDIVGGNVRNIGVTSEGKIAVLTSDGSTNDEHSLAILTKTPGSEVVQKEEIVIGVMNSGQQLMSAAVKFNKSSDKYHVSIREYIDRNAEWTENTFSDAQKRLNTDITSGNCPDLIDLSYVNLEQMTEKGVFEDLYTYLESSSVLNREDFLDNILESYTFNGKLAGIPKSFSVSTLIASSADLGNEMGWSLDEMIDYADAHSGAQLFDGLDQASMMQFIMRCNEEAFIDWTSGTCNFNSDAFKKVLEFVGRFPEDFEYSEDNLSTPTKIQNGEVLMDTAGLYDFREIQIYNEIFQGNAVCIGYPTIDGSVGVLMNAGEMYGILSGSKNKEGAWEFLESYLSTPTDQWYSFGFPTKKAELEEMAAEAVKIEYATDENGEKILDENGDPIISNEGGGIGYGDGWSYTYHVPTQEEVDIVMELLEIARPVPSGNDEIMTIINEEAAAFFKGQKTVDEVADTIQRRVQTYVSENS